ncbi:MAG: DUF1054 family protein [Deltaproteobacteria bacterium]|nr:DUF1054 family protein [Deltaproteobacteria bacterium]
MRFTKKDLEIFQVKNFADRMQMIVDEISPKLAKLGELIQPQLSRIVAHEIYTHVAQHARRSVNPPDETWVAFGPDSKGYKSYVYFAICVGSLGVQARITAKQEFRNKEQYGEAILRFADKLQVLKGNKEMEDYTRRGTDLAPTTVSDWPVFLQETAARFKEKPSAIIDLGINLPLSGDLSSHAIQALTRLAPFYMIAKQTNGQPVNNY